MRLSSRLTTRAPCFLVFPNTLLAPQHTQGGAGTSSTIKYHLHDLKKHLGFFLCGIIYHYYAILNYA